MYASQTKRLCVRGAPGSDDTRVPHPTQPDATTANSATSTSATTESTASSSSLSSQTSKPTSSSSSHLTTRLSSRRQLIVNELQDFKLDCSTAIRADKGATMTVSAAISDPTSKPDDSIRLPAKASYSNQFKTDPAESVNHPNTEYHSRHDPANSYLSDDHSLTNGEDGDNLNEFVEQFTKLSTVDSKIGVIIKLRDIVTACNKRKDLLVNSQNFGDILKYIDKNSGSDESNAKLQTQVALLLCSLAKSSEENIKSLNRLGAVDNLIALVLRSTDENVIDASLRCLRSLMSWPRVSQCWLIYEGPDHSVNGDRPSPTTGLTSSRENEIRKIVKFTSTTSSLTSKVCVADIFAATCTRPKDQLLLANAGAIGCITAFIESPSSRLVVSSLNWLSRMCIKNSSVSKDILNARCPSGLPVLDRLANLMSKHESMDLQFLSARCYAYIYRSLEIDDLKHDVRIVSHVLPTLVRMVHSDRPSYLRVRSAECIAYLIEIESRLQSVASICDRLIDSLANMLDTGDRSSGKGCFKSKSSFAQEHDRGCAWWALRSQEVDLMPNYASMDPKEDFRVIGDVDLEPDQYDSLDLEMKRAAFLALASLSSNLEPIRKKILNSHPMIQHLTSNLDPSDIKTLKSVLTCLLSLSRSVQSLRTSFTETTVYNSLKSLLDTSKNSPRRKFPHDVLLLLLGIVCNICLDFSPGKHIFLDSKTIDNICNLTRKNDRMLRLHGVWILMNMVYHQNDLNIKFQILRSMGLSQLLNLLDTKDDDELVLKTLGFLRNLFSQNKQHIDSIMMNHGDSIMQALMKIIDRPSSSRIKGQALCVLSNIADGNNSKAFIMENKALLDHLADVISNKGSGDMREAACTCITNLAHRNTEGSGERRDALRRHGIEDKLKPLLDADDADLADKARTAFNQFIIGADDMYVNNTRSVTS